MAQTEMARLPDEKQSEGEKKSINRKFRLNISSLGEKFARCTVHRVTKFTYQRSEKLIVGC